MKKYVVWMQTTIVICALFLVSCSKDNDDVPVVKNYFPSWNKCEALAVLQSYVEDVTNPESPNFISVEDRIATFDMDGTFVGELYPTYFEYNLLEYRALDDESYKDKAPDDVKQAAQNIRDFVRNGTALPAHFDMVHAYAALPANGFKGMTYGQAIYKPMVEVFEYLKAHDFTYYVVSGSDRFICRALAESIGIPANRVIGMDVKLASNKQGLEAGVDYTLGKDEHLVRTSELIIKNLKTNKVLQISQEIGKVPVLSFGNSSGDCAMHNYCLSNSKHRTAAFMLVADDDQRDHANLTEAAKREAKWRESGYYVISMKNDFRTIYGNGVEKTDFHFE